MYSYKCIHCSVNVRHGLKQWRFTLVRNLGMLASMFSHQATCICYRDRWWITFGDDDELTVNEFLCSFSILLWLHDMPRELYLHQTHSSAQTTKVTQWMDMEIINYVARNYRWLVNDWRKFISLLMGFNWHKPMARQRVHGTCSADS